MRILITVFLVFFTFQVHKVKACSITGGQFYLPETDRLLTLSRILGTSKYLATFTKQYELRRVEIWHQSFVEWYREAQTMVGPKHLFFTCDEKSGVGILFDPEVEYPRPRFLYQDQNGMHLYDRLPSSNMPHLFWPNTLGTIPVFSKGLLRTQIELNNRMNELVHRTRNCSITGGKFFFPGTNREVHIQSSTDGTSIISRYMVTFFGENSTQKREFWNGSMTYWKELVRSSLYANHEIPNFFFVCDEEGGGLILVNLESNFSPVFLFQNENGIYRPSQGLFASKKLFLESRHEISAPAVVSAGAPTTTPTTPGNIDPFSKLDLLQQIAREELEVEITYPLSVESKSESEHKSASASASEFESEHESDSDFDADLEEGVEIRHSLDSEKVKTGNIRVSPTEFHNKLASFSYSRGDIVEFEGTSYLIGIKVCERLGMETFNLYRSLKTRRIPLRRAKQEELAALMRAKIVRSRTRSVTLIEVEPFLKMIEDLRNSW